MIANSICLESVGLAFSVAGAVYGLGFPQLRAGSILAVVAAVIGVSTCSGYLCCCVSNNNGRCVFQTFMSIAILFAALGFVLVASSDETPCVRHDCFQVTSTGECSKCDDKGKDDCDPKLSYECTYMFEEIFGFPKCNDVKFCNNWDPDCSKSGQGDDDWFWGFESIDDCEKAYNVGHQRETCMGLILTATIGMLIWRIVLLITVSKAGRLVDAAAFQRSTVAHSQGEFQVVHAIEMAPIAPHVVQLPATAIVVDEYPHPQPEILPATMIDEKARPGF